MTFLCTPAGVFRSFDARATVWRVLNQISQREQSADNPDGRSLQGNARAGRHVSGKMTRTWFRPTHTNGMSACRRENDAHVCTTNGMSAVSALVGPFLSNITTVDVFWA